MGSLKRWVLEKKYEVLVLLVLLGDGQHPCLVYLSFPSFLAPLGMAFPSIA